MRVFFDVLAPAVRHLDSLTEIIDVICTRFLTIVTVARKI